MSKVMVCNGCEQPLIFTFAFPYCEYYCLSCGAKGGIFGTGHEVELTPELKSTLVTIHRKWGQVKRHIVASRFKLTTCNICDKTNENHHQHLTPKEKAKSEWALEKLESWAVL